MLAAFPNFLADEALSAASLKGAGGGLGAKREPTPEFLILKTLAACVSLPASIDLGRVFRHRYVLAHYLALAGPVFAAFLVIGPGTHRDSEHMPSVLVGLGTMLWAVGFYVLGVKRLIGRRAGPMEVWLTPGLMLGVAVLMIVGLGYTASLGLLSEWSPLRLAGLFVVLWLYAEVTTAIVLRKAVPRAVADLLARAAPVQALAAQAQGAEDAVPEAAEPGSGEVPDVLQGVLRLEAQGNHVLVVTERGRHLLPGPFGAMVARMPDDLGRQVHRSHWVACKAVLRTRRAGRDVFVETLDGAQVPVASSKYAKLRDWLVTATEHVRSDGAMAGGSGAQASK